MMDDYTRFREIDIAIFYIDNAKSFRGCRTIGYYGHSNRYYGFSTNFVIHYSTQMLAQKLIPGFELVVCVK